ncbi:MAG: hypothetical protein KF752_10105 [Pirellulaceae bacterium]|nr:hypothetical protein [Pirellulaceae bacterium]
MKALNAKFDSNDSSSYVDLKTIRRRVVAIKRGWTDETRQARKLEGLRRRAELEALVSGMPLCWVGSNKAMAKQAVVV